MIDPWSRDSTASTRALDNARVVERAALDLLADIEAGAFAGADTTRPIEQAMRHLAEAHRIAGERWAIFLNSKHEDKAA